jgi:hypothetical protein
MKDCAWRVFGGESKARRGVVCRGVVCCGVLEWSGVEWSGVPGSWGAG